MTLHDVLSTLKGQTVTFGLTRATEVSGEVTYVGTDFVALTLGGDNLAVIPFTSIAAIPRAGSELFKHA